MSFSPHASLNAIHTPKAMARIVIIETKGSTPRDAGTEMLVWRDGQSGTIGGGRLEWEAAKYARTLIENKTATASKTYPLGPELGQCCGGAVTLSFRYISEGDFPDPSHQGLAQFKAPFQLDNRLVEHENQRTRNIWIHGAGHVGRAIVDLMAPLPGIAITWVDTGSERFPEDVPETAQILPTAAPERVLRHAPKDAMHLILTYSHEIDFALCHAALCHDFAFCGLIGSATKRTRFRKRLRQLGHSLAQIDRIACPIGDPGLGKHPQAIALGVARDLLKLPPQAANNDRTRPLVRGITGGTSWFRKANAAKVATYE